MYAFILLLVIAFSAISIAYLKHCLQMRILNLIRLVDEYMTPSDVEDPDQTPLKVLERLDAIEIDYEDLTSDLLWDDSIERNVCAESTSNSSRSTQSEMNSRTVDSMAKYLSTPEYFPSFNIHMNISNSDISENDHQESKTRSGKIYKTM